MKKVTGSGGRLAVEIGWKNAEIEGRGTRMGWKRKQGWEDNRGVNSLPANLKRGSRRLGDDKVVVCAVCSSGMKSNRVECELQKKYKGREWRSDGEMQQLKFGLQAVGNGCRRKGAWRVERNRKG